MPDTLLVLHPDANIVHCDRLVRVTRWDASRGAYDVVEASADLQTILSWFEEPARLSDLVARHREIDARSLYDAVEALRAAGVLVETAPSTTVDDATTLARIGGVARLASEIADDLQALGPTDASVERRVRLLEAEAELLATSLRALRKPSVDAQLARLEIGRATRGLRLHLGAGPQRLPGWVNIDLFPAELAIDLRWGLPFADGSARLVYMAHVLEHFNFDDEALFILREIRRVLEPGGALRIVVPDLEKYFRAYVERDDAFFAARERHWGPPARSSLLSRFLHYAGAGARPDQRDGHKFGYDFELLRELLLEAGFSSVVRSDFMKSTEAELRVDDRSWAGSARHGPESFSLFVDAAHGLDGPTRAT